MKKIILCGLIFFCTFINAKEVSSINEIYKLTDKQFSECKIGGFELLKIDSDFNTRLNFLLKSFGMLKASDFDMSECLSKRNLQQKVITTFFWQKYKKFIGQNLTAYVAFDTSNKKMLIVLLDNDLNTYILGDKDKYLVEALVNSKDNNDAVFPDINWGSNRSFMDIGTKETTIKKDENHSSPEFAIGSGDSCQYNNLDGVEYRIRDDFKNYVTNSFEVYSDKEDWQQGSINDYSSLQNNTFKVIQSGVRTVSSEQALRPYLAQYRYHYIYNGNESYVADSSYRTKVVTLDCKVFYYKPTFNFKNFSYEIELANGGTVSFENFKSFLGNALFVMKVNAHSDYDRFEKNITIKTDMYDDYMIRASYSPTLKKVAFIQLYTNQTFYDDWAYISNAKDLSGTSHRVVKIDGNADCSGKSGCRLTETLGIDISEQFLKNNLNGFELKLIGKKPRVINVSGGVIKAFLKELNNVRK